MPVADAPFGCRVRGVLVALLPLVGGLVAGTPPAGAADHAAILVYHHVSERTPRSTSVTPAVFESHLNYLARHDFSVLPLSRLLRDLAEGRPLPPRSVALTFDDGYRSVHTEALPRLERRGWPFTVFVPTGAIGDVPGLYMSWDQLRDLEGRGGAVGNHSSGHGHLIRQEPGESEAEWRRRVSDDIVRAQARLDEELDHPLKVLAYPYGEFDERLERLVAELGFVGLGQQSGPVGPASDRLGLPRFPVATGFDDLESLSDKLRSRPLPVEVLAPGDRVLPAAGGPPTLRLRIPGGRYQRDRMRCYVAGQPPAAVEWEGDVATVRAREGLGPGRSKYTCTVASAEAGVFYWYSHLWLQPRDDGSWYSE